nr:glycine/sarcosine/betaine reductase selenoprotein B family protein [Bacillus piscicola]
MRKKLQHEVFKQKAKWMIQKNDAPILLSYPAKPMNEWTVAFLTTAGVHVKEDPIFRVEEGDSSLRYIPRNTRNEELMVSHTHFDTTAADEDISAVFPLEHLRELAADGVIGSVTGTHIGMMGYIPDTEQLKEEAIPQVIDVLTKENVDVLLMSPG